MGENRHRHTVWMDDAVWDQVESHYQKDNCSTKNEYIEKAIQFYSGYLNLQFFLLGGNPLFIFLCRPPFNIRCRVVFLIVRFSHPIFAIGTNAIRIIEKDVGT